MVTLSIARYAYADTKTPSPTFGRLRKPWTDVGRRFTWGRIKEAMVYFPEQQSDGSWAAKQIFTRRIPHSVNFQIDGPEFDLYRAVTQYVKAQSTRAAAQEEDPRARAVGFLRSEERRVGKEGRRWM